MTSKVFFSPVIAPEKVVSLFECLGIELEGKVAIKLHSGEEGNQNFLKPGFWRPIIHKVGGTVVECNTAYDGARNTTEKHLKLIVAHGWSNEFNFDLMDSEGPDYIVDIPRGKVIRQNLLGKNILNYDSMLVLSHFKGHPMGGFGGALKQLSIGCASSAGKCNIHSGGRTFSQENVWNNIAPQDEFLEAMADAASTVAALFEGKIAYINVLQNLSVDCDCCSVAEDPCMSDIGIMASLDPVAIDQACIDKVYAAVNDPGQKHFLERIESLHGIHTIETAEELGMGSRVYELIEI